MPCLQAAVTLEWEGPEFNTYECRAWRGQPTIFDYITQVATHFHVSDTLKPWFTSQYTFMHQNLTPENPSE